MKWIVIPIMMGLLGSLLFALMEEVRDLPDNRLRLVVSRLVVWCVIVLVFTLIVVTVYVQNCNTGMSGELC